MGIYYLFNNFADFNYCYPLIKGHQSDNVTLLFLFEDLRKKKKIFFKLRKNELLNFDFVKDKNIVEFEKVEDLKKFLRSFQGILVSTSPTIYCLLRKGVLRKKLFSRKRKIVAFDYVGEFYSRKIIDQVDLIFFSSDAWSICLKPKDRVSPKIVYGLPYWDMFPHGDTYQNLSLQLDIDPNKTNIIIPEILQEGDQWLKDVHGYIVENYDDSKCFYLKYRLKTEKSSQRNREWEKALQAFPNIVSIYSPYAFNTLDLFQNCSCVYFTSNLTNFTLECIAHGKIKMIDGFRTPRFDRRLWEVEEMYEIAKLYGKDSEGIRARFFPNLGKNITQYLKKVREL